MEEDECVFPVARGNKGAWVGPRVTTPTAQFVGPACRSTISTIIGHSIVSLRARARIGTCGGGEHGADAISDIAPI